MMHHTPRRVNVNRLRATFGTGLVAQPMPLLDPSVVLTADTVCWTVAMGRMDVASTGVALMGHARPPSAPGPGKCPQWGHVW